MKAIKARLSRTTPASDRALSKVTPDEPGPTRGGRLSLEVVLSFWPKPAESDLEPGGRLRRCRERCCLCCRRTDVEGGDPSSRPRSRERRPSTAERPDTTEDDEDSDEPEDEMHGAERGLSAGRKFRYP